MLAVFYAFGFSTGNVAGIFIEKRIAMGHVAVKFLSQTRGRAIAGALREHGFRVTVFEGDTALNSGTVFDPGDDTVTLVASVGTVIDNLDGTWSWSYPTTDGPDDSQTVTITATGAEQLRALHVDLMATGRVQMVI